MFYALVFLPFAAVSWICCCFAGSSLSSREMQSFVSAYVPLREDGKIFIPEKMQHVKIDIGLSYSAPMSQNWLSHEEALVVFGFEPNPDAVDSILKGAKKRRQEHGECLDIRYIGKGFFLIPCALGFSQQPSIPFYVTKEDCGCSSAYPPVTIEVEKVIQVPIFQLSDFLDLFPFDTHPIIEYIKIDAQGSDLNIVKSAGDYLSQHVVYITLEAENSHYLNTDNSLHAIEDYMTSIGFVQILSSATEDPTYINSRFADYAAEHPIRIFQW